MNFRERLRLAQQAASSLLCVGLDPDYGKIPVCLKERTITKSIGYEGDVIFEFNKAIIDATKDVVSAYKPQFAFYICFGDTGLRALKWTIDYIRKVAPNVLVILDCKDGDIGNTNLGYVAMAFKWLGVDAMTVPPYMSGESLAPFLAREDKGIIVLCKTSNPGSGEFQDLPIACSFTDLSTLVGDGDRANDLNGTHAWSQPSGGYHVPLYQHVALRVANHWNAKGNCGVVVGATYPADLGQVRKLVGDTPILLPGIGKQGGDLEGSLRAGLDSEGYGLIVNNGSAVIFAGSGEDFAEKSRAVAIDCRDKINNFREAVMAERASGV